MKDPNEQVIWKWFWAWQDDAEVAWLEKKAAEGWLLNGVALSRYTFTRGVPANRRYGIDYNNLGKNEFDNYAEVFRDAGWEYVDSLSGYHYFRTNPDSSGMDTIFSDNQSKINKYRKILTILVIVSFPTWFMMITGRFSEMVSRSGVIGIIYKTAIIVLIPILILYIIAFVKLISKVSKHKKEIRE